jgi:hypothetical protein
LILVDFLALTRKSTFFRNHFYCRVITIGRNYAEVSTNDDRKHNTIGVPLCGIFKIFFLTAIFVTVCEVFIEKMITLS